MLTISKFRKCACAFVSALVIGVASTALATEPGTMNPGFGSSGLATTTFGKAAAESYGIATDRHDRFLLAGRAVSYETWKSWGTLTRYLPDGTPDTTFGEKRDGTILTAEDDQLRSGFDIVTLDSEERILVGGSTPSDDGSSGMFSVLRFRDDGTIDRRFANQGAAQIDFGLPEATSMAKWMSVDAEGRIVVGGVVMTSTVEDDTEYFHYSLAIARLTDSGELDPSFADHGILVRDEVHNDIYPCGMAIDSYGRIIVAGTRFRPAGSGSTIFVHRYTESGIDDTTFGVGGEFEPSGLFGEAYSLSLDHTGRPLVGGVSKSTPGAMIMRLTTGGATDRSFGLGTGVVYTRVGTDLSFPVVAAIRTDSLERILAVGGSPYGTDGVVIRYKQDGSPDKSFGTAGVIVMPASSDETYIFNNGIINNEEQLTLGGAVVDHGTPSSLIAQLNLSD